jgi:hypothetical protein
MNEKTKLCELHVDPVASKISISGISDELVVIGYENDIDLTGLVMTLSKQIDSGFSFTIKMPAAGTDDKLSLVLSTINDIVDSYNASLQQPQDGSESDDDDFSL